MKRSQLWILMATAFLAGTSAAMAGTEAHGGRVWVCEDSSNPNHLKLLDYTLAESAYTNWNLKIDLGQGDDEYQLIRNVLARIQSVEPSRARIYLERALGFMKRVKFWSNEPYINVSDVRQTIMRPSGCQLHQLVLQSDVDPETGKPNPGVKFYITRELWNQLSIAQKAGVILHEIAYEDAVAQGHQYADEAMQLNATLASAKTENVSFKDWAHTLAELSFGYLHGTTLIYADRIATDKAGTITEGYLKLTEDPSLNAATTNGTTLRLAQDQPWAKADVSFYPNGSVSSAKIREHTEFNLPDGLKLAVQADRATFYPNGSIHMATADLLNGVNGNPTNPSRVPTSFGEVPISPGPFLLDEKARLQAFLSFDNLVQHEWDYSSVFGSTIKANIQGKDVKIGGIFIVTPEYKVLSATLGQDLKVRLSNGKKRKFYRGEQIFLNAKGEIASSGIYSLYAETDQFIRIRTSDTGLGFSYCSIQNPDQCERIGGQDYYDLKTLKKRLHLNVKTPMTVSFDYIPMKRWTNTGAVGGISFVLGIPVAIFSQPIGLPLLGFGAAGLVASTGYYLGLHFWENHHAYQRTTSRIVKDRYLVTQLPIEQFRTELEKALAKI